ncbi:hypothetical protein MKW94_009302 [Papaver nudicaule]|uniref:Metallothionein-like protein n=1 Tax=Papaver nudicaule TaxID=74823 RepID=A0AA41VJU8_PAPNU|nr:hypothetical protein [Papaver nudicaule]
MLLSFLCYCCTYHCINYSWSASSFTSAQLFHLCGMYPDLGESSNSKTLIFGVSSQKSYFEGSEMMGAEGGGCGNGSCSCGDSCTCGSDCKCGK